MPNQDIIDRAKAALDKRAASGADIDPSAYSSSAPEQKPLRSLHDLPSDTKARAMEAGVVSATEGCRLGSLFHADHSLLLSQCGCEGMEMMGILDALNLMPEDEMNKWWWKAVEPDADKYTSRVALDTHGGYFIRAGAGARPALPLQACLYIGTEGLGQNVHNIVVLEENAELHIITGCASGPSVNRALHIGVTEFYIGRGATLTFTMIHRWSEGIAVRPRSAAIVEEGGLFLSTFVCLRPALSVQMYPSVRCTGSGATARLMSILAAHRGSELDVGGAVALEAEGSRAEVVSRAISRGGRIYARGRLIAPVARVKGHIECRGLILSEGGSITAVPELEGSSPDVELSHEAAVGKIAEEEIHYLMARGLTEEEATSAIVTGFLELEITGLPGMLQSEVERAVRAEGGRGM